MGEKYSGRADLDFVPLNLSSAHLLTGTDLSPKPALKWAELFFFFLVGTQACYLPSFHIFLLMAAKHPGD